MNARLIALETILVGFLALTGYVLWVYGFVGFFQWALHNSATTLLGVDLVISLSLILFWIGSDAKRRGFSALPFVLLTLAFGSAGPLAYLIRRELAPAPRPEGARA